MVGALGLGESLGGDVNMTYNDSTEAYEDQQELIAELLAALEALVELDEIPEMLRDDARAAIAKAKGE
jgi:uncharacterized protein YbaR (Trm112 family)